MNISEFTQTPTAKLVDTGDNRCVLVLENWNVEEVINGYNEEEISSLIGMLQHSLDLMSRYNRLNERLPLFEQEDYIYDAPESSLQRDL